MKRFVIFAAMLALSGAAFAQTSGGEGHNTHCNGQGNPNSPCVPGTPGGGGNGNPRDGGGGNPPPGPGGNGGNGGAGGHGGDATAVAGAIGVGVGVGIASSQSTAVAASNAQAVNNNTVSNTNTNTATGGNATAEGGQAVSAAVVESGAVTVAEGAVQSNMNYTYKEVQQAPAIGQGSFAISGCSVAGNAGGSGPGWAGFLGFGFTPAQCYDFMLAQAYQSIGEKKAVCDILKNSKAGQRQLKRGITLPECNPEVVAVPVPVVVPPVDLSPYATKEELNRAFKASQSK